MKADHQPNQDRQIRVFISSTFRDMQAERDHLAKFVFPELRRLCESRGVVWTKVDLRWGVTEEQKAEGKVLPICLEEIRRSRPHFMGLLGERYGYADAVDASGAIAVVGNSDVDNVVFHAFLLAVPEPSAGLWVGAGVAVLFVQRRPTLPGTAPSTSGKDHR